LENTTVNFELFADADLGNRLEPGDGCAKPIGRRTGQIRRRRAVRPRRPSTAAAIAELRGSFSFDEARSRREVSLKTHPVVQVSVEEAVLGELSEAKPERRSAPSSQRRSKAT
jgi:hypothetical protein